MTVLASVLEEIQSKWCVDSMRPCAGSSAAVSGVAPLSLLHCEQLEAGSLYTC